MRKQKNFKKKRKNTRRRRCIELLVKSSLFFIGISIMALYIKNEVFSKNPLETNMKSVQKKEQEIIDKYLDGSSPSEASIPITGLSQEGIPTGCESVSTVCVLQYYGIDISIDKFIDTFLPCDTFYWQDGNLCGPNPHEFFVGNPYKISSLGCYPDVIIKALNKMKNKAYPGIENLYFKKIENQNLDTLVTDCISQQIPLILWATMDMKESYDGMRYYLEDGTLYTWKAQEHCVVVCGYNEETYSIMDPLADGEIVTYPKELVNKRYIEMGMCAIVIWEK